MKWLYDLTVCLIWPKPKVSRQATRVVVSVPEPPLRTVGAGDLVLVMPHRKSTTMSSLGSDRGGCEQRQDATNSKPAPRTPRTPRTEDLVLGTPSQRDSTKTGSLGTGRLAQHQRKEATALTNSKPPPRTMGTGDLVLGMPPQRNRTKTGSLGTDRLAQHQRK
jgi:hypothetical protein